jgi:hypothetical protein
MTESPIQTPAPALNPDLITGEPHSHPVGAGVGAAAAGTAGAVIGAVAGPIGMAVGVIIGAVAGGLVGKGVARSNDTAEEAAYWRENHGSQPYALDPLTYEDFAPAYRTGYTGYRNGRTFDEREADLRMEYEGGLQKSKVVAVGEGGDPAGISGAMENNLGTRPLRWEEAREAARAAYERVRRTAEERAVLKNEPMDDY